MSTHRVEVVLVRKEPHPDADTLAVVRVFGFTVCVRADDWTDGELAAYVPPDSLVDSTRLTFAFLAGGPQWVRIKVRRMRGIYSQGLLVKAPPGAVVGDDVMAALDVRHYEPPLQVSTMGTNISPPNGRYPGYDVESWFRYRSVLQPGERVVLTEKIHGASARYVFRDGQLHAGSRADWKQADDHNLWWQVLRTEPALEAFCRAHPELGVYCEVYGQVQDLRYGAGKGFPGLRLAAFDLYRDGRWVDAEEAIAIATAGGLPWVPVIDIIPYDEATVLRHADGPSLVAGADHLREGLVIRPAAERFDPEVGRVILKVVSNRYLERGK